MKTPCLNCGSISWTRWTMTLDQKLGKRIERCSDCPLDDPSTGTPNLGRGAVNKGKRITPDKYQEAVEKANRTGKCVDL